MRTRKVYMIIRSIKLAQKRMSVPAPQQNQRKIQIKKNRSNLCRD